jgi:hypothetical protein
LIWRRVAIREFEALLDPLIDLGQTHPSQDLRPSRRRRR